VLFRFYSFLLVYWFDVYAVSFLIFLAAAGYPWPLDILKTEKIEQWVTKNQFL